MLVPPRIHRNHKIFERESFAARHYGVGQSGHQPQTAKQIQCGASVYKHRIEQQGEQQSGRILAQPRIDGDPKTKREGLAGRNGGVE